MGIKRIVDVGFWTDGGTDNFSPEDRYFMLYLLTCPFTTQLGIYKISVKQAAFQMGWSMDAVKVLLDRFENKYHMIRYSEKTDEVAIKNFLRHSIIKGGAPVRDCLIKEMKQVKNKDLISWVFGKIKGSEDLNETVKNIIAEYEEKNGVLNYCYAKENDNENDNDNENEVSYHDSYHDSCDELPVEEPEKKKPTKADIDNFFNELWSLYPVKKGKGQVSESKRKVLYDIGSGEMHRAIHRYLTELKKDSAWRKPQNGSTFFNSGYVDYLDENFVPQQRTLVPSTNKTAQQLDEFYDMAERWAEGE